MSDDHDIDSDALDAGLDAVYREKGVRPGESVLDAIERRHGTTSRIELAGDPSTGPEESSPDDPALTLEGDRRYRIRGEIARGKSSTLRRAGLCTSAPCQIADSGRGRCVVGPHSGRRFPQT